MMNNPWLGMKEQILSQYEHHSEMAKKAENKMIDARNKIDKGDQSPDTVERFNKSKAELEAYDPIKQRLKQELLDG